MKRVGGVLGIVLGLSLACSGVDEDPQPVSVPAAVPQGGGEGGGASGAPGREPDHRLQALVSTSGKGETQLLDGDAGSTWRPAGVARDEGVLFRFEAPVELSQVEVTGCERESVWTLYVDGADRGGFATEVGTPALVSVGTDEPELTRSIFLKSLSLSACLAEVRFLDGVGQPLDVAPPRSVSGTVRASSTLDPEPAYAADYLFDQRTDFGWVEGAEGNGVGETVQVRLAEAVELQALEIWNGYQRSEDHFAKNARVATLRVSVDGGPPVELALADASGPQKLALPSPMKGRNLTLEIAAAVDGSAYKDLVISEVRLWDERGPLTVALSDSGDRATALAAQIKGSSLEGVVDQAWRGICDGDSERTLKLRSDHSFVYYEAEVDGGESTVFDGTWVAQAPDTMWSEIRFFGRRHRSSVSWNPYGDDAAEETIRIAGGTAKVAKLSELSPAWYRRLLSGGRSIPDQHGCLADRDFDDVAGRGAIVVEGVAMTDILVPAGP